ncbi:uncharacterized protein TNCV_3625721 [Trichonephila clavipes]|nr:uncharacterized protein TNCV_3625721 [Trichonephila clavipes]
MFQSGGQSDAKPSFLSSQAILALIYRPTEGMKGLLATDHVILNHGQVTWTTPELAPPLLTTTPHQREDVSALDRFNVHRCPTRWVFSGTGLEPVTKQATVRYLYHSATAATSGQDIGSLQACHKFEPCISKDTSCRAAIHVEYGNSSNVFPLFFFDKGENASQEAKIENGVYSVNNVTANHGQFWFRRFRSGILDVKDAPHTDRPIVENVNKITEIIEVGRRFFSCFLVQELKIDHKTILRHLCKV